VNDKSQFAWPLRGGKGAGFTPGTQMVIGQQANAEGKNPPETGGFVEKVFG
jgi:hypothetical protein